MVKEKCRWKEGHEGEWYMLSDITPCRFIDDTPYLKDFDFNVGKEITQTIKEPLIYTLQPIDYDDDDTGSFMPPYFQMSIPLLRDDLITSLKKYGINNFQEFEAVIEDENKLYTNYKAINIIGEYDIYDYNHSCTKHEHLDLIKIKKIPKDIRFISLLNTTTFLLRNELVDYLIEEGYDEQMCFSHFRKGLFFSKEERNWGGHIPECCYVSGLDLVPAISDLEIQ